VKILGTQDIHKTKREFLTFVEKNLALVLKEKITLLVCNFLSENKLIVFGFMNSILNTYTEL